MAITPLQIFQPQSGGLGPLLFGAQQGLGQALQGLMQAGRDQVNNQFQQERDFLAERRNYDAARERQGRYAITDAQNDRNFRQNVFNANRNFGLQERQEERLAANQLFSQDMDERRLALAVNSNARANTEADRISSERLREQEFNRRIAGSGAPETITPTLLFGGQQDPASGSVPIVGGVLDAVPTGSVTDTNALAGQVASETRRAEAAERSFNADVATEARANAARLKSEMDAENRARGGSSGLTPYQSVQLQRGQQRDAATAANREAAAAEKAAKKADEDLYAEASGLLTDADAFAPQSAFVPLPRDKEGKIDPKGVVDPVLEAKARKFDENQYLAETAVATEAKNRSEYIAKGGTKLTDSQKTKRGKFYDLVVKGKELDKATATEYLRAAGGDATKAREAARADGYKF